MVASLFLVGACGAGMRPIPDDVEPVPKSTAPGATLAAAAPLPSAADGGSRTDAPHAASKAPPCADGRGRALEVRRIAPDHWLIASGVIDVIRSERKAVLVQETDAAGKIVGFSIQDIGDGSCLGALGFATGDVLRSVNSHALDTDGISSIPIYQSIMKNGAAVVRFDRGGRANTVVYEVLGG